MKESWYYEPNFITTIKLFLRRSVQGSEQHWAFYSAKLRNTNDNAGCN
jgi:hypothetical protein